MKKLSIKILILCIGLTGFISCSSDDDSSSSDPNDPQDAVEIAVSYENLPLLGYNSIVSVTSSSPVDYNGNGESSTDIFSQMEECEKDNSFNFSDAENKYYFYLTEVKCNENEIGSLRDHYAIDLNHIYLSNFTPDTNTATKQLVLKNCKMERFRRPNSAGNDSYRLYYDMVDDKTGVTFRFVSETIEQ